MQAINTATGLRRETETSALGSYVLPYMETGTFHIEISKDGFAPLSFRNVKLEVGQPANAGRHVEHRRAPGGDERH